ncbi:GNAT family N-acetyltransferase [bacterium]|nr:GNAT family N-acetyltransferase [bacterium]
MIHYKKLNINDDQQLMALLKWENDVSIYHLITPVKDRNQKFIPINFDQLKEKCHLEKGKKKYTYLVYDQDKPLGQFSIHIDPAHLYKKINHSSWLGLCIGEKSYWGKGAGQKAMKFFEQESIQLGLKRVELGVFEFNTRAIQFYKKLGYQEIGALENFTYWNGQYWSDIRMEKYL